MILIALAFAGGCTTSQETVAFETLSSIQSTARAGYDGYAALVATGSLPTNDVPQVSHAYNDLQSGIVLAAVLLNNNTNALAPTNIVTEAADFATLLTTVEKK